MLNTKKCLFLNMLQFIFLFFIYSTSYAECAICPCPCPTDEWGHCDFGAEGTNFYAECTNSTWEILSCAYCGGTELRLEYSGVSGKHFQAKVTNVGEYYPEYGTGVYAKCNTTDIGEFQLINDTKSCNKGDSMTIYLGLNCGCASCNYDGEITLLSDVSSSSGSSSASSGSSSATSKAYRSSGGILGIVGTLGLGLLLNL